MADPVALVRAASNTTKIASALKNQWDVRTRTRAAVNGAGALDMAFRAQIDEVFLVLAHLGEALLPLGIFRKDYYLQTLGEVQASIASCGHELLPMAWEELDAELQYVVSAGLTICACYSPMPVYRGFGACVLGEWDWACPDLVYLQEKAQKSAIRTVYGFKQKVDPQPMRSVFVAFDNVIQILQVKAMAFLEKRPLLSSFSDHQTRYGGKPKKEVRDDLDVFEHWLKQLERRGHPGPKGTRLSSWGIPFATWTSPYSCHILKTEKDCETIMCNQMDPGRLLHSFVCRGGLNLEQGQILLLPPRSPAESLVVWLEGLPGTSHKTVKWEDLDTERFESKISKSLRKKIGQYPLPTHYAVRHPQASSRTAVPHMRSTPNVLEHPNTISPPPYSPSRTNLAVDRPAAVAELGHRDPGELAASPILSLTSPPQHAASLPLPGSGSSGLKSIHNLRRKTTGGATNANVIEARTVSAPQPTAQLQAIEPVQAQTQDTAAELHEDTASTNPAELESTNLVELPTHFQSVAPKGLSSRDNTSTEVPIIVKSSPLDESADSAEKAAGGTTEMTEEPESMTADPGTEDGKIVSASTSSTVASSGDQYLELLNKVARGEISPQALSEMLAKGSLDSSKDAPNSPTKSIGQETPKIASTPSHQA